MQVLAKSDPNGTYKLDVSKSVIPEDSLLVVFTDGKKEFACMIPKDDKDLGFYFEQAKSLLSN
jgi:hypothetical protein